MIFDQSLRRAVASVSLTLLAFLSVAFAAGRTSSRLEIQCVVADSNGHPLSSAQIAIAKDGNEIARGESDQNGRFLWRGAGLSPGRYVIAALRAGNAFAVLEVLVLPDGTVEISSKNGWAQGRLGGKLKSDDLEEADRLFVTLREPARTSAKPPAWGGPPSPVPPSGGGPRSAPPTSSERPINTHAVVEIFYATDRMRTGRVEPASFFGGDRSDTGSLAYGVCEVSIPRDHRLGQLEAPSILKFEFREDPEKHVMVSGIHPLRADLFFSSMAQRVASSAERAAFVFVHGYNVSFADAARRTAQLHYDLNFDGAPILYSWPSRGNASAYTFDEATAEWTASHLKTFLEEVATKTGASTVHLIAHSMGSRPLTSALKSISTEQRATPMPKFRQVVLAAPDIDAGVFRQLAEAIQRPADRVTLYASSKDRAIIASKEFHGFPRAGESGKNIVLLNGIDTIDVSALDTGFLGHSYFGDRTSVLYDLYRLIRLGLPPMSRDGLLERTLGQLHYWTFQSNH